MDDTNLVSSSSQGLSQMLTIAQEFYFFNNTKINFNKAVLICNHDPADNALPLSSSPAPFHFNLGSSSFDITPIKTTDSFRFLGVWFTVSMSTTYVKKQCKTEYLLFARVLRHKRLTMDQLKYLHNAILLPKVEYRLKASLPSEKECSTIMAPFNRVFKQASRLAITVPSVFLLSSVLLGITDLFQ